MNVLRCVFCWFLLSSICQGQANNPAWDSKASGSWHDFELVSIPSSKDGKVQKAYAHQSTGEKLQPLIISLHTWGGNYVQVDPLAPLAAAANWNFIHPDFRGPNLSPEACLSPLVVSDIDDAIDYMVKQGKVDPGNIFLVGVSGGGFAACGMLLKSRHKFHRILAWASITDLAQWYDECSKNPARRNYAKDILACVGNPDGTLNHAEADLRSPMAMPFPSTSLSGIDLYEGIDDGWKGSVPISHTLRFYNRLVEQAGPPSALVTIPEMEALCQRTYVSAVTLGQLGNRNILFQRGSGPITLTIFQGGHEMLPPVCFARLQALSRE